MTQDEIINKLKVLGIIVVIGEDYIITEKYKDLLANSFTPLQEIKPPTQNLNYKTLLNTSSNGGEWPIQLLDTAGFTRATAFSDMCEIPRFAVRGGYPLRGMSQDAINILGNIIADRDICPATFIDAVKMYYKYCEMPKAVKNLLVEGVIFEVYKEHIEGKLKSSLTGETEKGENSTWQ